MENLSQVILSQVALSQLILAHTFSTVYMMGVIYFVQLVHYPLFAQVGPSHYLDYHQKHMFWTTWVVGPSMIVEAATTCLLLFLNDHTLLGLSYDLLVWSALLLLIIWISTAFIQVPCHERLLGGFDQQVHQRLVKSNWIRTVAWSIRAILALLIQSSI